MFVLLSRSFLEGSVLGSSALLGAEELDRYFPNRMLGIYVVTWNMQGERVRHGMAAGRYPTALSGAQTLLSVFPQCIPANLNDLLLPTDSEFAQDFYVVGVQEGCQDKYVRLCLCLEEVGVCKRLCVSAGGSGRSVSRKLWDLTM